ncbi:hypothetical protein Back11_27180 [Paenibacillus baekrokdamisoli]|uniref:Uncharacterized protein n=1 Tax=Paenibacillus baekrokdamisoli TaxID=1712516 RepID=A0A3G9J922_9BACL|nr:AraC family transcriptional regulator [Paenibacillus baekrokdamisoli]MBB3070369.1 AraC-like DNA-binding protein [Paenibacillus baekrokdamisoli]BBH21373.1 hypothetical protein Back11_27180 [Paenibacillus baekrokdamisoli]
MEVADIRLEETLVIKKLQSFHYFEFAKGFLFEGESHDFWEFVYVDKGEITVVADSSIYQLKQGNIIFHKPNEFHTVWANREIAPNLIIICFECDSHSMKFFDNKVLSLSDEERNLLSNIIREGFNAFEQPFDLLRDHLLKRKENQLIASEQMIKIYLELFLISIMRKDALLAYDNKLSSASKERNDDEMIQTIIEYMNLHIAKTLTLDDLCRNFNIGKTNLKTMFKEQTNSSVLNYFKKLKIEHTKTMIRDNTFNLTEIAEQNGYSSIHSFSKQFKKSTGMSPSEYAKTVKARVL